MATSNANTSNSPRRFGKSPFWLRVESEQFGQSQALSATILYKTPRVRKLAAELPLIDITPRHPLFTIIIGSESFPLLISHFTDSGRGEIVFAGSRKLYLSKLHTVEWTSTLRPRASVSGLDLPISFTAKIDPPLPTNTSGNLQIEIVAPMHQPEPWWFPYGPASHQGAISLWGKRVGIGISLAIPDSRKPSTEVEQKTDMSSLVRRTVDNIFQRGRAKYSFHLRFDLARTRSHAQFLHMRNVTNLLPASLPAYETSPSHGGLRENAMRALEQLTDKGAYAVVGIERVHVKGLGASSSDSSLNPDPTAFYAGFPYFPLDSARAMLDWHMLMGDEVGARLGLLIARGIATDFAVLPSEENGGLNKGAFWDRRSGSAGRKSGEFTDHAGEDYHSVASTARIARGLFSVYERTHDLTCLNAALNACQWLILKQNQHGYYDGDKVSGATGKLTISEETLTGIEVAAPLLQAYRATKNEIFMKAAMRVMRHITTVLMPSFVATPVFRGRSGTGTDTPASVASLARVLALIYSETPTRRVREDLEFAATWLRSWDLSHFYYELNQDGRYSGIYEIVRASLEMLTIDQNPAWLDLALRTISALPEEARYGWQSLPIFMECMIGLSALLPDSTADLYKYKVRLKWSDYVPDPEAAAYITACPVNSEATVDFLTLVSQVDHKALVTVLSDRPLEQVHIVQNGRTPNVRDAITGELICQPLTLHKLPFNCPRRRGSFIIEP